MTGDREEHNRLPTAQPNKRTKGEAKNNAQRPCTNWKDQSTEEADLRQRHLGRATCTVEDGREGGDDPAPVWGRRQTLASGTRMDVTRSDPMGKQTVPAMEALDPAVEAPD
jgi:hypothetical protein